MKHILLALFLITSTAHGALTKVPAVMANEGVVSTPIAGASPKIYSFTVGAAGAVFNDWGDLVNGNCAVTNTSTFTCSFNAGKFTVAPNCIVVAKNGSSDGMNVTPYLRADETTSAMVYRTVLGNTAAASAQAATVLCHGY